MYLRKEIFQIGDLVVVKHRPQGHTAKDGNAEVVQRAQQIKVVVIRLFGHDNSRYQPLAKQADQRKQITLLPQVQMMDITQDVLDEWYYVSRLFSLPLTWTTRVASSSRASSSSH